MNNNMLNITEVRESKEIEFQILEQIRNRKSRRSYAEKAVEPEKIKTLFEAARWAPSSVNEQPWFYIYATKGQPLWESIFETLNENNKIWAENAPVLIVSMVKKNYSRNGRLNQSAKYDLGAANAFLSLQATDLGLNVHQMGGFDAIKLKENLIIPDTFDLGVIIAVGYLGDESLLPDNLRLREIAPRQRILQDEFVMNETF